MLVCEAAVKLLLPCPVRCAALLLLHRVRREICAANAADSDTNAIDEDVGGLIPPPHAFPTFS